MSAAGKARKAAEAELNAAWEHAFQGVPEVGDPEFWPYRAAGSKRLLAAYEALLQFDHPQWVTRALIDAKAAARDDQRKAEQEIQRRSGEVTR